MNIDISALASNAVAAFGEESVVADDQVVRIAIGDDASLALVARADCADALVCRAFVAGLARIDDVAAFCQEALEANFFWRGTSGATLSVDAAATSLYLTERLSPAEVADPASLESYVQGFVDTLSLWRLRVRSYQGGIEGLPESADFSVPESEREAVPSEADDMEAALRNGMEVFR